MTAAKTFPIRKMLIMGPIITVAATANALMVPSQWWNWITAAAGVGLVALALTAKLLGRTNA